MPLNLGTQTQSSGNSSNNYNGGFLTFNGKSGRYSHYKDEVKKEIQPPTFVADFDNIRTGWFILAAGTAPVKVMDKSLGQEAPQPAPEAKRGFELDCYSEQVFGGVAQFSSSALGTCSAINELYDQYERDRADHKGQLPVVKATGDEAVTTKHGTNYKPTYEIVKWVDRPAAFSNSAGGGDDFGDIPFDSPSQMSSVVSEF